MNRKHVRYFTALLLIFAFSFNGCRNDSNKISQQKAIAVITQQVGENVIAQDVSVSGNIEGNKTVKLGFMVAGKINQINVAEGQNVGNGQLIASLDASNYSIAKEVADVQANQAADEYRRLKTMYDRNSISESDYRKIGFTLQGAKAQQKLQNKNLSDTKLYVPFSGVLLKKNFETGEIVSAGTPVAVVSDISTVKVNAYIPENQLGQIRIGKSVNVRISALDKKFTGKITEVGTAADVSTRAFTIKVQVANPELNIRPGMIAEVKIPATQQKSLLVIPASAILRTPEGQPYIFIADKGQAFQRNLSIGNVYGDKIEIVSGLSSGETIITGGQQKLTNGSKISVTNK
jgi:RND family efflux transporter MFP subunit